MIVSTGVPPLAPAGDGPARLWRMMGRAESADKPTVPVSPGAVAPGAAGRAS